MALTCRVEEPSTASIGDIAATRLLRQQAQKRSANTEYDLLLKMPMTGIAVRCAHAAGRGLAQLIRLGSSADRRNLPTLPGAQANDVVHP